MNNSLLRLMPGYYQLLKCAQWQRYGITSGIILMIFCIWYGACYRPISTCIKRYRHAAELICLKKQELSHVSTACLTCSASLRVLENQLNDYTVQKVEQTDLIMRMMQVAWKHKLVCSCCHAENRMKYDWYSTQNYHVDVQGTLDGMYAWLQSITADVKLLSIESLTIAKIDHAEYKASVIFDYLQPCACVKKSPSTWKS